MARGVVVSRSSPGRLLLRSGSMRSRRVTSSPMLRMNCVNASGPADAGQQDIGGGVVAVGHHGTAQLAHGQCRRRPARWPSRRPVSSPPGLPCRSAGLRQRERAVIHLPEQRGDQRQLERGRHGVTRVVVERDALAALRVQDVHAEPSADALVNGLERGRRARRRARRARAPRRAPGLTSCGGSVSPPPARRSCRFRRRCVSRISSDSRSHHTRVSLSSAYFMRR